MSQPSIHFFTENIFYRLKNKMHIRKWIVQTIQSEGKNLREINVILCSDEYLLAINQQYLQHDTYTDIITFDHSDDTKKVMGDIFISIERVNENAKKFNVTEQNELHRVMIHGVLHLLGYGDKSDKEKAIMTEKENYYLSQRNF